MYAYELCMYYVVLHPRAPLLLVRSAIHVIIDINLVTTRSHLILPGPTFSPINVFTHSSMACFCVLVCPGPVPCPAGRVGGVPGPCGRCHHRHLQLQASHQIQRLHHQRKSTNSTRKRESERVQLPELKSRLCCTSSDSRPDVVVFVFPAEGLVSSHPSERADLWARFDFSDRSSP